MATLLKGTPVVAGSAEGVALAFVAQQEPTPTPPPATATPTRRPADTPAPTATQTPAPTLTQTPTRAPTPTSPPQPRGLNLLDDIVGGYTIKYLAQSRIPTSYYVILD